MADFERPPHRRATYQDVLDAPEHKVAELIDGELFLSPRPASLHARATSSLGMSLAPFDRGRGGPGGWQILDEPELHFDDDVLVPDLAGWRLERMPQYPDCAYFTLAPDWVCEVLSPSTATLDRTEKLRVYARERVQYLWLVDPLARTLEVMRLNGSGWVPRTVHRGDDVFRAEPFDAIEFKLALPWPGSAPPASSNV